MDTKKQLKRGEGLSISDCIEALKQGKRAYRNEWRMDESEHVLLPRYLTIDGIGQISLEIEYPDGTETLETGLLISDLEANDWSVDN